MKVRASSAQRHDSTYCRSAGEFVCANKMSQYISTEFFPCSLSKALGLLFIYLLTIQAWI
jgi:hypothetical protein